MSRKRQVGLSRRELEWAVASMTRQLPRDPAELAKALCDVMVNLIDKNNEAIARAMDADREERED